MSSERLYTEAEAVEIIQRALSDPASEAPTNGLTQNDLWRIAEEAGATRSQFDSALAETVIKSSVGQSKNPFTTINLKSTIAGELTPDDFIVMEEQISEMFEGKFVKQEGRTVQIMVGDGSVMISAIVSSRKGQTSIRVSASHITAFVAAFFLTTFTLFAGVFFMLLDHSWQGWFSFILAPLAGLYLAIVLAKAANKKGLEFFNLLSGLVSNAVAGSSVESNGLSDFNSRTQGRNETTDLQQGI